MISNDIRAYASIVQQPGLVDQVKASEHPAICLCFVLLKALPVALYLVRNAQLFTTGVLFNQLLIILLVADFWYTKNVAGRALVGLRWWLDENDQGRQMLKIQCRINQEYISGIGSKIFWFSQVVQVVVSILLLVFSVISYKLFNVLFVLMMVGESCFNLICFVAASRAKGVRVNILTSKLGPGFQKMLLGGSMISFV